MSDSMPILPGARVIVARWRPHDGTPGLEGRHGTVLRFVDAHEGPPNLLRVGLDAEHERQSIVITVDAYHLILEPKP